RRRHGDPSPRSRPRPPPVVRPPAPGAVRRGAQGGETHARPACAAQSGRVDRRVTVFRRSVVKPSILRSFETLIKGMDPSPEPEPPPEEERAKPQVRAKQQNSPRMVVAEGEFLGRKWQVYSDGAFEGETVAGMEVFRDLEHFKGFVEDSPLLRSERAVPE